LPGAWELESGRLSAYLRRITPSLVLKAAFPRGNSRVPDKHMKDLAR
jgi:hypothetical protein